MTTLEPLRFKRILVPVDESRPSQNSLAVAAGLARETGAEVILAHVVQMRWSQDEAELKATYGEIIDDYRRSGEATLRRTAESEVFSGLDVDTQLLFGTTPPGSPRGSPRSGRWTPSSWGATGAGASDA